MPRTGEHLNVYQFLRRLRKLKANHEQDLPAEDEH